ncbi:MAG: DUF4906 domain-containing protein [Parabacteroides sp.]|nr:DUF4906 domain-containing protein [Parabacteroides sp.]
MTVVIISMLMSGCEDRFDSGGGNPVGGGEPVEVNLNIGFEDEADGYELSSKAGGVERDGAFDCELVPSAQTRSGSSVKPDALYNLEIRQYGSDNACLNTSATVVGKANIGSRITVTLAKAEKCQLVLVAWGKDNSKRLGTGDLSAAQDTTLDASVIKDLNPAVPADMNKMPYVLHLKDVNVSSNGHIYSNEGEAIDVRLRLKRLAARLTFNWTYSVSGYTPQQILIQGIPTNYKVVASPDKKDNTYPSLLDQFTTMQATISVAQTTGQTVSGTYSCWIPANVRGTSSAASTATSRTKANAPTGSSYIRFISVKNGEGNANQKLDYRIYLGGKESTDFNVRENTNYIYNVTFNHSGLPVNDRRVTIVDPSPASKGNSNFVNTANCFMVPPGGAFCFNPYKYTKKGVPTENTVLQDWCSSTKIQSVRVLWQTLENGDVGDPVLGTANSSTDHSNIVALENGDSFADARIYCRVAPNTTGGSGVIAAYSGANGEGDILWSWHIWVTDYSPDQTKDETVLESANKRMLKFGTNIYPMMDRNLGAIAGYIDKAPDEEIDRSKANGFHYQWGRKDLFPSSYTSNKNQKKTQILSTDKPTFGIMSLYQADGVTFQPFKIDPNQVSYRDAYKTPLSLFQKEGSKRWISTVDDVFKAALENKGVHDPCPAGWRIALNSEYQPIYEQIANDGKVIADGGILLKFGDKNHSTYIRLTGLWRYQVEFNYIGTQAYIWMGDNLSKGSNTSTGEDGSYLFVNYEGSSPTKGKLINTGHENAALSVRCIQDR